MDYPINWTASLENLQVAYGYSSECNTVPAISERFRLLISIIIVDGFRLAEMPLLCECRLQKESVWCRLHTGRLMLSGWWGYYAVCIGNFANSCCRVACQGGMATLVHGTIGWRFRVSDYSGKCQSLASSLVLSLKGPITYRFADEKQTTLTDEE